MNKSAFFFVTLILFAIGAEAKIASYDRLIEKLVQLNQDAGKTPDQVSIKVSEIKSSIEDIQKNASGFYGGLKSNCDQGKILVTAYIEKIKSDLLSIKTSSDKAGEDNKRLEVEFNDFQRQFDEVRTAANELEASIEKSLEDMRVYGVETEQKLVVIKTLRDIITDELLKPEKATSFVQLKTFSSKLAELKALLENSRETLYNPLVTTLITLTETRGFSDEGILRKVLELLNKLEQNLNAFKEKQAKEGKAEIKAMKDQLKEKKNQMKNLREMIKSNVSNIQDNMNIISQAEKETVQLNSHIKRKEDEIAYWEKICKYEEEVNQKEELWRQELKAKLVETSTKIIS